ncbi:uncharacterized protein LOC124456804 isoform X1 [Xenia sp. Carnegie-2017]|uniref:uncharacterized protein LOC124456804 isoform X1 n=1 Tax=Xenia sp. Carnegie-2017 TaxID=2897299 RepID=UPI001F049D76|nr:uncharacterized protein LOC124456804 isoform X1 [Xenia sp. Carnegie-2017]
MPSLYLAFMFANSSTILFILLASFHTVITYTHWVLNDQGRIRSKVYSEFQLRKPENLVIFLRIDDDLMHIKQVRTELAKEKKFLEVERDEEIVDLVMKYHAEDEHCLLARKPLKKFDLKISTLIPFNTLGIRFVCVNLNIFLY